MDRQKSDVETTDGSSPLDFVSPEFPKKRVEELAAVQTELFDRLQEVSRNWLNRMQSETTLACDLSAKLTVARSIPETASAYQEWASRHIELASEDMKWLLTDNQKIFETGPLAGRGLANERRWHAQVNACAQMARHAPIFKLWNIESDA